MPLISKATVREADKADPDLQVIAPLITSALTSG
jgi:hypothetical protein